MKVFIEPIHPMDIIGNTEGAKLGKVRVRSAETSKEVNIGKLIGLTGRQRGTERLFQYDTVYVIARPHHIHQFVKNWLEERGFTVVNKPTKPTEPTSRQLVAAGR